MELCFLPLVKANGLSTEPIRQRGRNAKVLKGSRVLRKALKFVRKSLGDHSFVFQIASGKASILVNRAVRLCPLRGCIFASCL